MTYEQRFEALDAVHCYMPRSPAENLPYESMALALGDPIYMAMWFSGGRIRGGRGAKGEAFRTNVLVARDHPLGKADLVVRCAPSTWACGFRRQSGVAFNWRDVPRATFGFWKVTDPPDFSTFVRHVRGLRAAACRAGVEKRHYVLTEAAAVTAGWVADGFVLYGPPDVPVVWESVAVFEPRRYADCVIVLDAN